MIFASKIALRERRIGEQSDALALGEFGKADLEGAVDEIIGVLDRNDARPMAELGGAQETRHAPGRFIGQADVTNLAGLDETAQRFERFFDRNFVALCRPPIGRAACAPKRKRAIRPMQLVKVDVVGLQPLERALDRMIDILGVENGSGARGAQPIGVAAPGDLGGDDRLIAVLARGEPASDDAFGRALRLSPWRNRINFRRIDEIDAAIERIVQLRMAFRLAVLLSPHHRAETDRGNREVAISEFPVFHEAIPNETKRSSERRETSTKFRLHGE